MKVLQTANPWVSPTAAVAIVGKTKFAFQQDQVRLLDFEPRHLLVVVRTQFMDLDVFIAQPRLSRGAGTRDSV